MASMPRIRPSAAYFALAAPFFVIGVGLGVYTLIHGLMHITDLLTQVVVPGGRELTFQRQVEYTIFLEEVSVVDGKAYLTQGSPTGLACKVESLTNGQVIEPGPVHGSTTYSLQGRSGRAVLSFSVPENGRYRFSCDYPPEQSGPPTVLAVGHGVGGAIVRIVLGSLTWGGAGMLLSTILIVVVAVARERSKKRLREAPPNHATDAPME
jgi:hypothetical protein